MEKLGPWRCKDLLRILSLPLWRHADTTSIEMVWRPWQSAEVRDKEGINCRGSGKQTGHRIWSIIRKWKLTSCSAWLWPAKRRKEAKIALTILTVTAFRGSRSWHHNKRLTSAEINSSMWFMWKSQLVNEGMRNGKYERCFYRFVRQPWAPPILSYSK